jgi:Zn-dependent protease
MIGADLTVQLVVVRLVAGLIIAIVQGLAIAWTAVLLGDKGPRYDGRLTVLPSPHVDLLGLGSIMLTGFGWGRPVAIDAGELRLGRWGLVVAVLAGSVALLLVAVVLLLLAIPMLRVLDFTAGVTAAAFVRVAARLCVWMALFALLPIPTLAGAHFLTALGIPVPKRAGTYLGWGLLVASIFGVTSTVLTPAYNFIAPLVLGVDAASS